MPHCQGIGMNLGFGNLSRLLNQPAGQRWRGVSPDNTPAMPPAEEREGFGEVQQMFYNKLTDLPDDQRRFYSTMMADAFTAGKEPTAETFTELMGQHGYLLDADPATPTASVDMSPMGGDKVEQGQPFGNNPFYVGPGEMAQDTEFENMRKRQEFLERQRKFQQHRQGGTI